MKILAVQGDYVMDKILEIDIEEALKHFHEQLYRALCVLDRDTHQKFTGRELLFPTNDNIRNAIEQKLQKTNRERLEALKKRLDKNRIEIIAKELGVEVEIESQNDPGPNCGITSSTILEGRYLK